jgi:hypothetical protein
MYGEKTNSGRLGRYQLFGGTYRRHLQGELHNRQHQIDIITTARENNLGSIF